MDGESRAKMRIYTNPALFHPQIDLRLNGTSGTHCSTAYTRDTELRPPIHGTCPVIATAIASYNIPRTFYLVHVVTMRFSTLSLAVLASAASTVLAVPEGLKIDVTTEVECERQTQRGDKVDVHYRGTLAKDGSEFDASYKRGKPLSFVVGKGSVIKGYPLQGKSVPKNRH